MWYDCVTIMSSKKVAAIRRWFLKKDSWKHIILTAIIVFFVTAGCMAVWIATLKIPDLSSFQNKILAGSTKIYDRTGNVLLYDIGQNVHQEVVPFDQISQNVKNATISIEDNKFYQHSGIEVTSILRAFLKDAVTLKFSQGGSTITQQVVKNSLLTADKTIPRKIKEWVLSLKLERVMTKDQILNLYLNGTSYGGNIYGIEQASKTFFGIPSSQLDIAQAAYIAGIPQAPTHYSPYGTHKADLEARKNTVLATMRDNGYITADEYATAKKEQVTFKPQENNSIKAPHFVMYIKDYLVTKYGEDMVDNGSLKVTTTLDYDMQQKAEAVVNKYALSNTDKFNATNAGMVATDPTTGQILVMVGSRDYFDKKIDGQFNITIAHRQPGSSFKPFVYATAFEKGYTADTVLFDLPTQFSTTCDAYGKPLSPGASCYMPQNYDGLFNGPISLRNALAQSRNIPSIQTLYLAGIKDSITTAEAMGITSLGEANQYGLTLVLGGGEVSPLEMTGAYSVFANNGIRNPNTGILSVADRTGKTLEEFTPNPSQAIPEQIALQINDILHDNNARLPLNGAGSATDFPSREVALKTGTTNDYRDVWIIGYTPQITVGAWAGNNDNSPMVHKTSGLIIAPLWRAFMDEVLPTIPSVSFKRPDPIDPTLKPILRGIWQGNQTYTIDSSTGLLATDLTPANLRQEKAVPNIHNILYWVNKSDPTGPPPTNPAADPQFNLWETPVMDWLGTHQQEVNVPIPTQTDNTHTQDAVPNISISTPAPNSNFGTNDKILVNMSYQSKFPLQQATFYVNNILVGTSNQQPFAFSFIPANTQGIKQVNTLRIVVSDQYQNQASTTVDFMVH